MTLVNEGKAVFGVESNLRSSQLWPLANSMSFDWLKKVWNLMPGDRYLDKVSNYKSK